MITHRVRVPDDDDAADPEEGSEAELLKAVRLLDDYGTDKISIKFLKCVAKEFGERMTDVELQESWSIGVTSSSRRWTKQRRVRDAAQDIDAQRLWRRWRRQKR